MKLALTLTLTILIALVGCSDDSTAPQSPHTFTLELSADPFGAQEDGGLVWLSNPDGDLLATATWSADTTLVFDLGDDAPDTISFTTVVSTHDELSLFTEFDVPIGASRRLVNNSEPSLERSAEIHFENVPPHQSSMLSYQNRIQGSSAGMLDDTEIYFYTEIVDVFVRLDPESGPPLGTWLRSVVDGDIHTIDFAAEGVTEELTPYLVSLPDGCTDLSSRLSTWLDSGSQTGMVAFDYQDMNDELPATMTMHAPQWPDSNLVSSMNLTRQGTPPLRYHQYVFSARPTAFVCLPGEFTVSEPIPASLSFTMTGDWDHLYASWRQEHDLYGNWWIAASSPRTEVVLPQLPEEFLEAYPGYTRQGFTLRRVELTRIGDGERRSVSWSDWGKDGFSDHPRTWPCFTGNHGLQ